MAPESNPTRSRSNPALNLEEALSRLEKMKENIGLNGPFSRDTLVRGIGYGSVSGTSGRAVGALVHYGLLTRFKDMYSLSELGKKYLVPTSDSERQEAIEQAVLEPALFSDVFNDYEGQVLPNKLANILTVKYGIQYKVADSAVKILESSLKFAGLLNDNGILGKKNQTPSSVNNSVESSQQHVSLPFIETSTASPNAARSKGASQQGVNENGEGWSLVVDFQNSRRLNLEMRKEVRNLIEAAHELADKLYESDEVAALEEDEM